VGCRGPTVGLTLGLRKGQAQNFITLKKGLTNNNFKKYKYKLNYTFFNKKIEQFIKIYFLD